MLSSTPFLLVLCIAAPFSGQPLHFIENCGQWDSDARFMARTGGLIARLEPAGISFFSGQGGAVRWVFEGAREYAALDPQDEVRTAYSFFIGNKPERWRSHVPAHRRVRYRGIYEGVDLEFREAETRGSIEYDLHVFGHADLEQIVIRCEGVQALSIEAEGSLRLETDLGLLRQPVPRTWEELPSGEKHPVECRYRLLEGGRFGFEVPAHDPRLPLVIDPAIQWGVFLGGSEGGINTDAAGDLKLDPAGKILVTGQALSFNEPPLAGHGGVDAWIARLHPDSGEVEKVAFIGGSAEDAIYEIAAGPDGTVTFGGYTTSDDLPVTNDSVLHGFGIMDAWIGRIDLSAESIEFLTYLGGEGEEGVNGIALDPAGDIVVLGYTASRDFPVTDDAFQPEYAGGAYDAFLAKIRPGEGSLGEQLRYSTFFGGTGMENASDEPLYIYTRQFNGGLLLEPDGTALFTGTTHSPDLPITVDSAFEPKFQGGMSPFLARLKPGAEVEQLLYGTFLRGTNELAGARISFALARDPREGVWIAGDSFLAHVMPDPEIPPPEQLVYSTVLPAWAVNLGVSPDGVATVIGFTDSANFFTTPCAQPSGVVHGGGDAFLQQIRPDPGLDPEEQLIYSALIGGGLWDQGNGLLVLPDGKIVVSLYSESPQIEGFPDLNGNGGSDGFIAALDLRLPRADFTVNAMPGGEVTLDAGPSTTPPGTRIISWEWDLGDGAQSQDTVVRHAYEPGRYGRYEVTLTVKNDLELCDQAKKRIEVRCPPGDSTPWIQLDVGDFAPLFPGAARFGDPDHKVLRVCAGGKDIGGKSDSFHFVFQEFQGDGAITARVSEFTGANGAKAGLMVRFDLDDGSPYAALVVQKGATDAYSFSSRLTPDASARRQNGPAVDSANAWIRLERQGNEIQGFTSSDGQNWTRLEKALFPDSPGTPFPEKLLFGIAAAGRDPGEKKPFKALHTVVNDLKLEAIRRPEARFRRGDVDSNGALQITDAVRILGFLFLGEGKPECLEAADTNDDGTVDISDAIANLAYQFIGGTPPAPPGPITCGEDSLEPFLGCERTCTSL